MIISKSSLQCVLVAKQDRVPMLNNVLVEEDGTTVGSNGKAMLLVSPVTDKVKSSFPLKDLSAPEQIIFSEDTAKEVLKNLPRDTKFGGVLEHCNVQVDDDDEGQVNFSLTDGKRTRYLVGKRWQRKYLDYQEMLKKATSAKSNVRVVVNLKRLIGLLEALERACPDTSGTSAAYLEFSEDNDIIIRGVNHSNGQRAIGVMQSYKEQLGSWLEPDEWERKLNGDNSDSIGSSTADLPRNCVPSNHSGKLPKKSRKIPKKIS